MTHVEILASFEKEIGMIDDLLNKPNTDDSLFWLNQAVAKFIKLRLNGDFVHRTGFEETEKRRIDLEKLIVTKNYINPAKNSQNVDYDKYVINYNNFEGFLYELGQNVVISDIDGNHTMNTCVFECTIDSFMYRVNNSLTDFHYRSHRARPLRVRTAEGCILFTDKNYKINSFELTYIRKPNEISLLSPMSEYKDFNDVIIYEIIKMAALMYLENIKSDRYKTISEEVLTQE